ncbi:MAG: hypothetical protein SWH68_08815 [Thermodesulfobacteriota bacterium]|nr:hypothetical protein [Thermodesulfobacteriota bacterium]
MIGVEGDGCLPGGNTLPRFESWQVMHPLTYREPITEDIYGKLFKDVGRNEEGVQSYFSGRAARLGESPKAKRGSRISLKPLML